MTPFNTDQKMAWMTRPWRVVMVGPDSQGIAIDDMLTFSQPLIRYQHLNQDAVNWSNFSPDPSVPNALIGKVAGQPFQIVYSDTSDTLTCTMKSGARPLGGLVKIGVLAALVGTAAGEALAVLLGLPSGSFAVATVAATIGVVTYGIKLLKNANGPVPTWVANDGGAGKQALLQATA